MIRAADLTSVEFTDPKTVRLISTAYIDEPAMAPLADNEEDLAILEDIEGMTSARQTITLPIPGGLHPGELLTEAAGYGWTLVNAAFCYTRSTGNRFTSQFHVIDSETKDAVLSADPALAYPAGQVLARDILASGGNGILYPSAREASGQCLVALRPHLVQNIRQGGTWDFVWAGAPVPTIHKR